MLERYFIRAVQKLHNGQRGEGVDGFVTYGCVYFEGEGEISQHSYVTASAKLRTQRALHSIFSVLWNHQKEKCR